MPSHSEVPPDTLAVALEDEGIEVRYADGRRVFYRGVPEPVEPPLTAAPGKYVHVLVTDEPGTQGVLVYVDERTTEDEILETTGVGRVLLDADESASIFPGVTASRGGLRVEIDADLSAVDGRVFVFVEDEASEQSFELLE